MENKIQSNNKPFIAKGILNAIFFFIIFSSLAISVAAKAAETTMNNLNKALRSETNASRKYELFAKKADEEGYKQVAKLFRTVSMAESIHANNHRAVILTHGGTPDIVNHDLVKVLSTKENLKEPISGEKYEQEVIYPKFIKQAKAEKWTDAMRSFTYAENAEKQHERLFKDILKNLGKNQPADYFVNKTTGATFSINSCTMCPFKKFGPDEDYIRVR